MKWEKLGKIFDPGEHELPCNCFEYAQSPQALVFDDFVRIYFSTREKEQKTGMFLSHIAFVDFSKSFNRILQVSSKQVIPLGQLGCFDEHGIFPMNVLRYNDKILAYTCGWSRRVAVSVDTGIGLAFSNDNGMTFDKIGSGPVLTSSLHEPFLVGDPFVSFIGGYFHMWYIYGTVWKRYANESQPDRTYKIGHAVSKDGISWSKTGRQLIEDKYPDESQALPTHICIDGTHHLFFCYRQSFDFRKNKDRGYRIGYAWSKDLTNWKRDDNIANLETTAGSWDSDMMCYPHVFKCDNEVYMLYNGNEFGRYGFGIARLLSI
jgi:hypothetical protein